MAKEAKNLDYSNPFRPLSLFFFFRNYPSTISIIITEQQIQECKTLHTQQHTPSMSGTIEKFQACSLEESSDIDDIEGIKFINYRDESQLDSVMRLVGRDLSEPYSGKKLSINFFFRVRIDLKGSFLPISHPIYCNIWLCSTQSLYVSVFPSSVP